MKTKIEYIPLYKIKPLFDAKISDTYLSRMKKTHAELEDYDNLLAVEKNPHKDEYVLVGGYDKYRHLLYINQIDAPCLIENWSYARGDRELKILRRLFNKGDSGKDNKQTILDILNDWKVDINQIVKKTGFTKNEIYKNYKYSENIPKEFINENTSEKTLNWIETLPLDQEVKNFLYTRAGLPKGDSKRLTHDNIKIIMKLFKEEPRFEFLTSSQQQKILSCAINFKGIIIAWLKEMITEYCKPHRAI